MKKAKWYPPKTSATPPTSKGTMAPPKIIITNSEEPCEVFFPKPSIASVKIFDHMIELNNPKPIIAQNVIMPAVERAMVNNIIPANENIINVLPGRERPITNPI